MRICGIVASLGSGGAERVMTELCRAWSARGDTVTLITLDDTSRDFYEVPQGVNRIALGVSGVSGNTRAALTANVKRLRAVRSAVVAARPDVVVSFTDRTNILVLLALRGTSIPVIVSERNDPRMQGPGRAWSALRRFAYPLASGIAVQTSGLEKWAQQFVGPGRVHVIPNPIRIVNAPALPAGERSPQIVAMGRLVRQKSFDTLIDAFALVHDAEPEWCLTIFGEGPDRAALEKRVRDRCLVTSVSLPGRTADADEVLRAASIFALSSRHEGFPNVLLEACVASCACVATDCPSGPADIITHGKSGLLVPVGDAEAMADALLHIIRSPALRSEMGAKARIGANRFTIDQVLQLWDRAFDSVKHQRGAIAA